MLPGNSCKIKSVFNQLYVSFSIGYDPKAEGEKICENDNPMGVAGGKLANKLNIRYTYSVNWNVSIPSTMFQQGNKNIDYWIPD